MKFNMGNDFQKFECKKKCIIIVIRGSGGNSWSKNLIEIWWTLIGCDKRIKRENSSC